MTMIKKITLSLMLACVMAGALAAAPGKATLKEGKTTMLTYGFSDPDPVANPDLTQYPYFRFDGFESVGKDKEWTTVLLENDWISVTVFPEIGGKVWGAVDKTRGLEFVYYNHVVKFRDIAMRGAWTSGGIEFNFGIIGHVPSTATPVDYITRKNEDGSVSCLIASFELLTRTWWTVEINVPSDKAYFTTTTRYINTSSLEQPYYNWSNAAFKAGGNLQLCMPGDRYIGHPGDAHAFPVDPQGRDLSWFSQNAFGDSKSYHIIGDFDGFFGAYWHDDDFGYVHYARPDEKLGRKFFCWSQSRSGEIWKDLLTDTDGQYVEMQAGRMFNQPSQLESIKTPFKHNSFMPAALDDWTEYWYPVENIGAFKTASPLGALSLERTGDGKAVLQISPVSSGNKKVTVTSSGKELFSQTVSFSTLKPWSLEIKEAGNGPVKVMVGDNELVYDEDPVSRRTNRPDTMPEDFDWNTAHGHCLKAEQLLNVNLFGKALDEFKASLAVDKWYAPALRGMASLDMHLGRYDEAFDYAKKALMLNTYDGEANYLYGLAARATGRKVEEKDGLSLATYSGAWQDAAYLELARTALSEKDWNLALTYAGKSSSIMADLVKAVAYRKLGNEEACNRIAQKWEKDFRLFPFLGFEISMWSGNPSSFKNGLRCELPHETMLEMALWYLESGLYEEAATLCSLTDYATAKYLRAYVLDKAGEGQKASKVLADANASSPEFVFPFRPEMLKVFDWAAQGHEKNWKLDYYKALILWRNADKDKALELLDGCGDKPDYNPFYLTRAKMRSGEGRLADLKKAEAISQDWRTGKALVDYYMAGSNWKEALEAGDRYFKKYPDKFEFGLAYADALCGAGQYDKSLKVLSKLQVMPKEGARRGHQIYRNACLGKAKEELKAGKYAACIKSVEASKIWDERLGVGKPYDEMIDLSEENAIIKAAREKNRHAFD
jgi:tetratricopeptide (TPR) repeat protein